MRDKRKYKCSTLKERLPTYTLVFSRDLDVPERPADLDLDRRFGGDLDLSIAKRTSVLKK